jgi:RNA-directed DNA polymerase
MEAMLERENLKKALARVKRNKGAAGIDGISVDELPAYLSEHWPTIEAQLLAGTYKPQPVRRAEIPKASGCLRPLSIPTMPDRFIQQAMMQVLQARWDATFSETSFGFRPGRSAHQAVERAQTYIASGPAVVVDIDPRLRGGRLWRISSTGQPRHPDGVYCQAGCRQASRAGKSRDGASRRRPSLASKLRSGG